MLPAVALLGLLLGPLVQRGEGDERQLEAGRQLALGMVGAMFTLSALSKWTAMGWGWTDGEIHALLIFERGVGETGLLAEARLWMGHHPDVCGLFAAATLIVESTGALLLFPRTRRPWIVAAVALLVGFMVLPGVGMNLGWILVLVALGWLDFGGRQRGDQRESASA